MVAWGGSYSSMASQGLSSRSRGTVYSKSHVKIVSQLADLFDCRRVMLDIGQPGELPLMRELTALKRARSLRDPSTVSNWKSPVLGTPSSLRPRWESPVIGSFGRNVEADHGTRRHEFVDGQNSGGSARKDSRRGGASKISMWSESLNNNDARRNWNLGIDGSVMEDVREEDEAFGGLHEEAADNINGEKLQGKPTRSRQGEKVQLHNWRNPSWAADMEGIIAAEAARTREWVQRQSRSDTSRRDRNWAPSRETPDFENQAKAMKFGRKEQGGREGRPNKASSKENATKQNTQILSPLILNSLDDVHNSGHSLSLFTLEEPYNEHYEHLNGGMETGLAGRRREAGSRNFGSRSQSPLLAKHLPRSSLREPTKTSRRSQQVVTSSASTSQRTASQGSIPGAWEAASNQLNDELDVSELPRNGCGIPCYWSKNQKRGKSLLDVAGRSLSCGFPDSSRRKANTSSKLHSGSQRELAGYTSERSGPPLDSELEAIPLLTEPSAGSDDGAASSVDDSDRLSSDLNGELGLASTMNGPRSVVSNVPQKSRLELPLPEGKELAIFVEIPRSLSQKYRPKVFEELVGQNIVAQALSNAILKGKIAPVYLFQGSRGTGKTSAARIFATALNCVTSEEQKPCGSCRECLALAAGKSSDVKEVDAASNNGIERVKALLENTFSAPTLSRYKVFIIDECHMLTAETWNALLKLLEEPPRNVVFILITTDPDKLPRTAVSRCQKFPFPKIKDSEIVSRLQKLANLEELEVEPGALDLIASRSEGSLRDAETTLDQLSLLGHKISLSTIHELVGSVSDEKLLGLLDLALSSDTVSTVRKARELVDSGVEPLALMSQLATLITDILAGSYELINKKQKGGFFCRHALSEEDLERLRIALRILSEAEKQLRAASNDRTTWLTAALLQFGPDRSFIFPASSAGTSATESPITGNNVGESRVPYYETLNARKVTSNKVIYNGMSSKSQKQAYASTKNTSKVLPTLAGFEVRIHPAEQSPLYDDRGASKEASLAHSPANAEAIERHISFVSPDNLDDIWCRVLEGCSRSLPLRQLLHNQGKLLAISISEDDAVVHLEFGHPEHKSRGERSRKSIANAFQTVLGLPVEVKISLASLPAGGEDLGPRAWSLEEKPGVMQGGFKNCGSVARVDVRLQPEDSILENGPLHFQRNRGGVAFRNTAQQASSPNSFPAIPQFSNATAVEPLPTRSPMNNPSGFEGGIQSDHKAETAVPVEERLESAWIREARRFSPLRASNPGDLKVSREFQNEVTHQEIVMEETDMMADDYIQQLEGLHTEQNLQTNGLDSACPNCNDDDNSTAYDPEEENLRSESRLKYGGLLCWKAPKMEDEKVARQHHHRKSGILVRFVPCAKAQSQ